MAPIVVIFFIVSALALLLLPRRWAALPLIAGACYVTRAQAIEWGPASLTVVRLLIAAGIVRLVIRREWIQGGVNGLDWLMAAFGFWMIASVAFHVTPSTSFVGRVRDVYEAWGLYLLFRVFCGSPEDVRQLSKIIAIVLVPIGVAMTLEKITGSNPFAPFGGIPALSVVRDGAIRAQGPFTHPILAGSIGGVCLPLVAGLWRMNRLVSLLGIVSCTAMVIASGSSGPIVSTVAGIGVLCLWPLRKRMGLVRWSTMALYFGLDIVMKQPAYFIIAHVDLMGGSTSWYRAELIRSAFIHFNEWWLVGTDYTRHWMASGISADPNSADIVNHFLAMGVEGGLLLMALFIWLFVKGFWRVGRAIRSETTEGHSFLIWAVGASLFAHAATCLNISYFDHSIMFLYITLATTVAALPRASALGVASEVVPVMLDSKARASSWRRPQPSVVGAVKRGGFVRSHFVTPPSSASQRSVADVSPSTRTPRRTAS